MAARMSSFDLFTVVAVTSLVIVGDLDTVSKIGIVVVTRRETMAWEWSEYCCNCISNLHLDSNTVFPQLSVICISREPTADLEVLFQLLSR